MPYSLYCIGMEFDTVFGCCLCGLRDRIIEALSSIPGTFLTGDPVNRLPGFASFTVEGIIHSAYLVNDLNEAGISVSSGSACSAASREASHVLLALGYDSEHASGSLRITLGRDNTEEQIDYLISVLPDIIMQRRLKSKNNPLSLFDAPHAPDTID